MGSFDVGSVILDKYEVTRVLGKGGMGLVVAARHRVHGGFVALKFLLPALAENAASCARFVREARTATRITDQHVARVLDVDTVDGTPFLVMEYLTGKDLARVIRERGPLPVAEAVDLLLQACEAIADAHNLGIVHRDLKPANLFLTTGSDGTPFIKVLDFGISKSADADDLAVTGTAAVLGTPRYMSPEQLASSKTVDARTDVWALGVILYQMLTGTAPFDGESFGELAAAITRGTYTRPSDRRPEIPAAVDQVIAETLAHDREARLASVEAFATRIAPFGSDGARASCERIARIAARPPAPAVDAPEPPLASGPPSPVGKAPLAGITATGLSRSTGERPSKPRRRPGTAAVVGIGATLAVAATLIAYARSGPSSRLHAATAPGPSSASEPVASSNGGSGSPSPAAAAASADAAAPVCPLEADKDNACYECRDQNCCAESVACQQSPDCRAFLNCTDSCKTQACRLECIHQHRTGHATAVADIACGQAHCAGPCGTRNAQPCLYCQESNCSRHITECIADPECDTLRTCIASCGAGHDRCLQDCRSAAPTTAQIRYDAITSCGLTYCLSTCVGPASRRASGRGPEPQPASLVSRTPPR